MNHLRQEFRKIRDAFVIAFVPPAIDGLGNAGGFQLQLQDRGNAGLEQLQIVAVKWSKLAMARPVSNR